VAQPDKSLAISFRPGHIMPLHRGAAAKMLLANLPARKQQQYLAALEPQLPPEELFRLESQLEIIGQINFAESESEVDSGVWAVAAPVIVSSRVLGSVSIVAPAFRIPEETRARFRTIVKEAASEIAKGILNETPDDISG
jgi:DNA-binding IclR family transcriptional regulator